MAEPRLTLEEKTLLLSTARGAVEAHLKGEELPALPDEVPPSLAQHRGAFVTLTVRGRLRGCIGTFRGDRPLIEVVQQMALSAAFSDPRFPNVGTEELGDVEFEISALTPLHKINDVSEIEVGVNGIYLTLGVHAGVLLPQVAVEYGWDREEFLEHTCTKAGLPVDSWRKGATIEIFSAEVFSESDPDGAKVVCGD